MTALPYGADLPYDADIPYGGAMTRSMYDAAFPPDTPPKVDIVNRYIGGGTPHVWTQAETDAQVAKSGARYVLPNFVRVPPTSHDPNDDAAFVVAWFQAHHVPKGVTHALDYETAVDATYLRAYDAVIVAAGYRTVVYGSRSFVLQNPKPSGGYWTAHWNNTPHLCSDAGVVATQYGGDVTLGQPWDINQVADGVPLWDVTGQEDPLTPEEHDALMWLRQNVVGLRDGGVRMTDHGDPDVAGKSNHLKQVRADIAEVLAAVQAQQQQTTDPETLATLLAGKLEITGIQTDPAGLVTVTFGPKQP